MVISMEQGYSKRNRKAEIWNVSHVTEEDIHIPCIP